jgi:hypothetical protein
LQQSINKEIYLKTFFDCCKNERSNEFTPPQTKFFHPFIYSIIPFSLTQFNKSFSALKLETSGRINWQDQALAFQANAYRYRASTQ